MDAVERMQKAIEDDHCGGDEWTVSISQVDLAHVLQENARMRAKIAELQSVGSALVGERQEIRAALSGLYEDCEMTYMGGHHADRDVEIFRHGMKTVCNVVDAAVAKILGRGK